MFNFRGVLNLQHLIELLVERGRRFIEKHIESRQVKPQNLEEVRARMDVFIRNLVVVQGSIPLEELRQMLTAMVDLPNQKDSIGLFAAIFDDPSFVFNRIDSYTIKSDARTFAKLCNQLVHLNNVPVVLVDSIKNFYDDDRFDELRMFLPAMVLTSVSDILYLSVNDQKMHKVSQLKCSRDLVLVETKP